MLKKLVYGISSVTLIYFLSCNPLTTPNTSKHIIGSWEQVPVDSPHIYWTFKDNGHLFIKSKGTSKEYTYEVFEKSTNDHIKIYKDDSTLYRPEVADRWKVVEADKEELYFISVREVEEDKTVEGGETLEFAPR